MKHALGLATAAALILAAQIDRPVAQTASMPAASEQEKGPLTLSGEEKDALIQAAVKSKARQKTPKDFTPEVGAPVPRTLHIHSFEPEVAGKVPTLKHYWYAFLDREILLLDSMKKQVAAVIPLPEKYVSTSQEHHGAVEPATEPPKKDGASTAGSVPAYTSPESLK
jgi:hypothetical protein